MKPHPRIRKTIKWGGVVVSALLVVVCIAGGWVDIEWHSSDMSRGFGIIAGSWFGERSEVPLWAYQKANNGLRPGFKFECDFSGFAFALLPSTFETKSVRTIYIPTWMPAALVLVPTIIAWRNDARARRAGLNLCPKCNYDRAGLAVGAKCPECGSGGAASG